MGSWALESSGSLKSSDLPSCCYRDKWRPSEGEDWPKVAQEVKDDNGVLVGETSFHIRHCRSPPESPPSSAQRFFSRTRPLALTPDILLIHLPTSPLT